MDGLRIFIMRHTKVCFSIQKRESTVGNLTAYCIIEQSIEGEEVYKSSGSGR